MSQIQNILFLCTGNSCRSIMAEGLMRYYGEGKFTSFSAGSNPAGFIHPLSVLTMKSKGLDVTGFYSKSWDELKDTNIDIVITVCTNAEGEICPAYLGSAIKAHWGVEDPAHFEGNDKEVLFEFKRVCEILERRILALSKLDITNMDDEELHNALNEIGAI